MKQARRRRNIAVIVRMNETEYADFISRVKESGLSQQAYMIRAVRGAAITTAEEIDVLKTISRTFADLERQLRGLATNVNQMAHTANAYGFLPSAKTLELLSDLLCDYRKESERIWLSIRSSINQPKATGQ